MLQHARLYKKVLYSCDIMLDIRVRYLISCVGINPFVYHGSVNVKGLHNEQTLVTWNIVITHRISLLMDYRRYLVESILIGSCFEWSKAGKLFILPISCVLRSLSHEYRNINCNYWVWIIFIHINKKYKLFIQINFFSNE